MPPYKQISVVYLCVTPHNIHTVVSLNYTRVYVKHFGQGLGCDCRVPPLFQHWFSMTFPLPKNENPWPISTTYIYPNKWYTTYKCIPELVVTVPSARTTIVKKIKRFIMWLYKWSRVIFTELLSAVVKILWHYHHFIWLSMTFAIFYDFPGLENGLPEFHDFPWPGAPCDWPCKNFLLI